MALARGGYLERAVPGLGKGDPIELWLLFNELEKAGAPYDGISITMMIAGVVILAIAAGAFLAMVAYLDSYLTRGAPGAGADASSQAGAYRP